MSSRRQREGWYVGACQGRHVRRRTLLPALMVGDVELFPASVPMVDNGIAWLTLQQRGITLFPIPRRFRYRTKAMECEVRIELAGPDVETPSAPSGTEGAASLPQSAGPV